MTFKPTQTQREQVELMAGRGLPKYLICSLIGDGIDNDTMKKYFAKELVTGKAKMAMRLSERLIEKALDGDTNALIWYSKAQLGWKDCSKLELTGNDGGPIQITKIERVVIDAKDSTD